MDVAIICDFVEEGWISMDFVANTLLQFLPQVPGVTPHRICPPMTRPFSRLPIAGRRHGFTLDRLLNRLRSYPRYLRTQTGFDAYHIVDHSYAHLAHVLPPGRFVATCHDVDTFRCLFYPSQERRSYPFRRMTAHILDGLRKARRVACSSTATRDELLRAGAMPARQLEVVPLGISPIFRQDPDPEHDAQVCEWLGDPNPEHPEILHVGSVIERKRIDVLLHVFAGIRRAYPSARLIRAGGVFTPAQQSLAASLGVSDAVVSCTYLNQRSLATLYRRCAVALFPSDREGFGLPVAEAMACGATLVSSDLPVLRETGGAAAVYCRAGDPADWVRRIVELLREGTVDSGDRRHRIAAGVSQAARFTSAEYARRMAEMYSTL